MSNNSRYTAYTRERLYHIAASTVSGHQHFHRLESALSAAAAAAAAPGILWFLY